MYLILNKTINILDSSTLLKEIYFHPKVTFKRLNLLEPNNQNKNCDSQTTESIKFELEE
jgi:hypothetical protein